MLYKELKQVQRGRNCLFGDPERVTKKASPNALLSSRDTRPYPRIRRRLFLLCLSEHVKIGPIVKERLFEAHEVYYV